jgi:hypothetical protein
MRKHFDIDDELLGALTLLAADAEVSLERLAHDAFRDLLKKHNRPANLRDALTQSLRTFPANDNRTAPAKGQSR